MIEARATRFDRHKCGGEQHNQQQHGVRVRLVVQHETHRRAGGDNRPIRRIVDTRAPGRGAVHQPAVDMDSRCDWGRRRLSGWWSSHSGWKLLLRMRDAIIALCATPYMLVMK